MKYGEIYPQVSKILWHLAPVVSSDWETTCCASYAMDSPCIPNTTNNNPGFVIHKI